MARGQKSFKHKNNTALVSDDEIYMMVILYTYQHKSLDYLARKFNVNYFDAKEIIIRSRFGGLAANNITPSHRSKINMFGC